MQSNGCDITHKQQSANIESKQNIAMQQLNIYSWKYI